MASPTLSFTVPRNGYGHLTIENVVLGGYTKNPQKPTLQSPPLKQILAGSQGSATDTTSGTALAQAGGAPSRGWAGWFSNVYDIVSGLLGASNTVAVQFETPSVDETDSQWYFTGQIDGSTDPVTFTYAEVSASKYGLTLEVGDYVLWDDARIDGSEYSFEIDQVTAIDPGSNSVTLQRRQKGGASGSAAFGTLMHDHTGADRVFYRMVDKLFTVQCPVADGPQVFKLPWENMCVAAVVGTTANGDSLLVNLILNVAASHNTPPAPGMRTLLGGQYIFGSSTTIAAGTTADFRIPVANIETIRVIFGYLVTPGTGATVYVVWVSNDQTTACLLDILVFGSGDRYSYSSADPPEDRQMPYHANGYAPPPAIDSQDWPPNLIQQIVSPFDGSGNLVLPCTPSTNAADIEQFTQGGYLDLIVISGDGAGLAIAVQT